MGTDDATTALALASTTLRRVPYGFFVTVDGHSPNARLVQHLRVGHDCAVSFVTSPRSRKLVEARRNPAACYSVEDREHFAYVSVLGDVVIDDDADRRRELWEEGLRAFFPGGPDSGDVVLVRVEPRRVELMSFAAGVHPEPYGLSAQVLERRAEGWFMTTSSPGGDRFA